MNYSKRSRGAEGFASLKVTNRSQSEIVKFIFIQDFEN
jgi:hypothetical protein